MNSFDIQIVSMGSLSRDGYQRDLDEAKVADITSNFDAAQWDLPKVVETGAKAYRVVAGQHRVEAARRFLAKNEWPFSTPKGHLQVQVVRGIESIAEEADLFLKDAANSRTISPFFKHRAALVAGYPHALDIQAAFDRYGIQLVRRQRTLNGKTFVAITSLNVLWRAARPDSARVLMETLRLMAMWPETDAYRTEGTLVEALGLEVRDILISDGHVARLERVVKAHPPLNIVSSARREADRTGQFRGRALNHAALYAQVIHSFLRGRPPAKRPDAPFDSRLPNAPVYATGNKTGEPKQSF